MVVKATVDDPSFWRSPTTEPPPSLKVITPYMALGDSFLLFVDSDGGRLSWSA